MEGKQRTALQSRLIGTWPTTGDGGRVDEFFHAWADEGDAEQVAVIVVGDYAGPAGAAVGVQAGPGHRLAGADVDHADAVPGAFGLVGDEPDGPGGRVAEEYLRHGVVVGGDGMGASRAGSVACPAARGTTRNRLPPVALIAPGRPAVAGTRLHGRLLVDGGHLRRRRRGVRDAAAARAAAPTAGTRRHRPRTSSCAHGTTVRSVQGSLIRAPIRGRDAAERG